MGGWCECEIPQMLSLFMIVWLASFRVGDHKMGLKHLELRGSRREARDGRRANPGLGCNRCHENNL